MNNELTSIKRFFESNHIPLSTIWLEMCVNWCKDNLGTTLTLKELQSKVYEQWLLSDLRDLEVAALPPDLSSKKLFTLTQNICLQIMQIIDISKPKLWQLQRIQNSNALTRSIQKDYETVGDGKRVLQITLTDGVQEVEAMEYRPIPCLNLNLAPGTKIRLIAPVTIRRGRIMLERHKIEILGGEVEDLLISNAAENVLARALNLPINPNPRHVKEDLFVVEQEEKREGYQQGNVSVQRPTAIPSISQNKSVKRTYHEMEENELDEEIELMLEAEKELSRHTSANDTFRNGFASDRITTSTQIANRDKQPSASVFEDEDDIFQNIDFDDNFEIKQQTSSQLPQTKIMTLSKLIQIAPNVTNGVFKTRARFKSVVEKLTIEKEEFNLVLKIEDNTGEMTVKVHSDIVADFAGYSPAAILALKQDILNNDEDAKNTVINVMQKIKEKILLLDNLMTIHIKKGEKFPIIKEVL